MIMNPLFALMLSAGLHAEDAPHTACRRAMLVILSQAEFTLLIALLVVNAS